MTFLMKFKKCNILSLADELGLDLAEGAKVLEIKNAIISMPDYCEIDVNELVKTISDEPLEREQKSLEREQKILREKSGKEEKFLRGKSGKEKKFLRGKNGKEKKFLRRKSGKERKILRGKNEKI